jgi:NAD(P)-dependent dehydrogenase (short-subunit alcohol dehydrogenase family)
LHCRLNRAIISGAAACSKVLRIETFMAEGGALTKSKSKQIVLTGVSRGLGLASAAGFIERGHVVHGCARSRSALAELTRRWTAPHTFRAVDVAADEQVRDWAEKLLSDVGPPDLLINNAAIINQTAPLWEIPADEFDRVIDIDVKGTANVLRHFLPAMVKRAAGVVVNFSSGWGRATSAEVAPYCAAKYAIEGLTKALAQELPAGMAAVPLNPGIIDTDMLRICFGGDAGSYPDPSQWAAVAVPYILGLGRGDNGQSLSVPE